MRQAGGTSTVIGVDDQSPATPRKVAAAIVAGGIDGVLSLNSLTGTEAVQAVRSLHTAEPCKVATFDLGPDVLKAVRGGRSSSPWTSRPTSRATCPS